MATLRQNFIKSDLALRTSGDMRKPGKQCAIILDQSIYMGRPRVRRLRQPRFPCSSLDRIGPAVRRSSPPKPPHRRRQRKVAASPPIPAARVDRWRRPRRRTPALRRPAGRTPWLRSVAGHTAALAEKSPPVDGALATNLLKCGRDAQTSDLSLLSRRPLTADLDQAEVGSPSPQWAENGKQNIYPLAADGRRRGARRVVPSRQAARETRRENSKFGPNSVRGVNQASGVDEVVSEYLVPNALGAVKDQSRFPQTEKDATRDRAKPAGARFMRDQAGNGTYQGRDSRRPFVRPVGRGRVARAVIAHMEQIESAGLLASECESPIGD